MSLHHSPKIVTDGLVLCLDAANRKSYSGSGTVWKDLAGNNNGTLTNGPTFSSENGGSIVFDGVNDYVDFTNSSPSNVVSVSIWMNLNNSENFPIILAGNSSVYSSGSWSWSMFNYNSIFYIRGNNGGGGAINIPASTLVNVWTNWVLVRNDGSNICRAYRNGILFGTSNETSSVNDTLSIGRGGSYLNGRIPQVHIYNRALTPTEVLQNYNSLKGRFGL